MIIPAGVFKQKCLAIIDDVAKKHKPIIISKYGKPIARLMPLETDEEIENRILSSLRSGGGRMLVDEKSFIEPSSNLTDWAKS